MNAETVLLICSEESTSAELLSKLWGHGHGVVGPAENARMALAMAAQHPATIALVASAPTGRRSAVELAQALKRDWGIGSIILDNVEADEPRAQARDWAPRPSQAARVLEAIA